MAGAVKIRNFAGGNDGTFAPKHVAFRFADLVIDD